MRTFKFVGPSSWLLISHQSLQAIISQENEESRQFQPLGYKIYWSIAFGKWWASCRVATLLWITVGLDWEDIVKI